jgi:hypothetical protein
MTNSIALSQLFFPSSSSLVLPSAAISRIVTTTIPLSSEIGIKPKQLYNVAIAKYDKVLQSRGMVSASVFHRVLFDQNAGLVTANAPRTRGLKVIYPPN